FVSFKNGFVRHDGHAMRCAAALVIGAVLLRLAIPANRAAAAIFLASLAGAAFINSHHDPRYLNPTASFVTGLFTGPYVQAVNGLERALSGPDLETLYAARMSEIRAQTKIPPLHGTTDIYSYGQAALIASGSEWVPRPNLQSHAAYTPALAEADRAYLL